ncbi:hypothetical protein ACXHJ6_32260, partial [Streptomyces sp. A3]
SEVAAAPLSVDPATEWAILPDPEGDAPLRPACTRTREGVSHRARYARRQAARRARRSIRRQATPHGTLLRSGRGVRRVHEWIA